MFPQPFVYYRCTPDTFCPSQPYPVRWLDWSKDACLALNFWALDPGIFRLVWKGAREGGLRYCAVVKEGQVIAQAAVRCCSNDTWELAEVLTAHEHYREGYALATCSFITTRILRAGRTAICVTTADNIAMQRTAERIGYQRVSV